jgi:excinuclease UvrABC ATPase subunit
MDKIKIKNAKTHNLKNISISIPKKKIVVFNGVSGSGKSSLVFDTIYTEAQRQLIETFSSFARRRLPKLSRPPVEEIKNLSTSIVIEQKRIGKNMRSTVGTYTEIYTYLRMLYSRFGEPSIGPSFLFSFNHPEGMCPYCLGLGKRISIDLDLFLDMDKSIREGAITHPEHKVGGWAWRELTSIDLFDVDKPLKDFTKDELNKLLYTESIPIKKKHGSGVYSKNFIGVAKRLEDAFIQKAEDEEDEDNKNIYLKYFIYKECNKCGGSRLNEKSRSVKLNGKTIPEISNIELTSFYEFMNKLKIEEAESIIEKIKQITHNLIDIGAPYLTLNIGVSTLSGGESQRLKIARQINCDLVDIIYILDEPSIGLHPRDNVKIINMLKRMKDQGNSVFVIEHDPDIIKSAEWIIEVGPKSGKDGGEILYSGTLDGLMEKDTITSKYLKIKDNVEYKRRKWSDYFQIRHANVNNLKNLSVNIPKSVFTCVTGVSGSGKSSLIHEVFVKQNREAILIDQSPVVKSSRSIPASYIGIFDDIRKEFARATDSSQSNFSFNSKGECPKCKGMGYVKIEMSFLDDVKMLCDECEGKRYKKHVLDLHYQGKNIYDILCMTISEAKDFFKSSKIKKRLKTLCEVGLDYLEMGQVLSTLSGGEAQRIKLASELHKESKVYVMDEPTTGLHMADIDKLMKVINNLVDAGNTVMVIEHNLDVIKHADWIIDLGPEGGNKGGEIVAEGTPEQIADNNRSYTGKYIRKILNPSLS